MMTHQQQSDVGDVGHTNQINNNNNNNNNVTSPQMPEHQTNNSNHTKHTLPSLIELLPSPTKPHEELILSLSISSQARSYPMSSLHSNSYSIYTYSSEDDLEEDTAHLADGNDGNGNDSDEYGNEYGKDGKDGNEYQYTDGYTDGYTDEYTDEYTTKLKGTRRQQFLDTNRIPSFYSASDLDDSDVEEEAQVEVDHLDYDYQYEYDGDDKNDEEQSLELQTLDCRRPQPSSDTPVSVSNHTSNRTISISMERNNSSGASPTEDSMPSLTSFAQHDSSMPSLTSFLHDSCMITVSSEESCDLVMPPALPRRSISPKPAELQERMIVDEKPPLHSTTITGSRPSSASNTADESLIHNIPDSIHHHHRCNTHRSNAGKVDSIPMTPRRTRSGDSLMLASLHRMSSHHENDELSSPIIKRSMSDTLAVGRWLNDGARDSSPRESLTRVSISRRESQTAGATMDAASFAETTQRVLQDRFLQQNDDYNTSLRSFDASWASFSDDRWKTKESTDDSIPISPQGRSQPSAAPSSIL